MVTAAAGAVKGEFQAIFFGSSSPVIRIRVNIKVVNEIAGTGHAFDHEKLKEITVGQVTVDTLGRKPLGILTAVYRLLPGCPKRCHDMAADTKGIGIGGFNHKAGCQHRYNCQNNADSHSKPPAFFAGLPGHRR